MRREWIEILFLVLVSTLRISLPPCGGSGLKYFPSNIRRHLIPSPSMRREWIEISLRIFRIRMTGNVSLHAEGVD